MQGHTVGAVNKLKCPEFRVVNIMNKFRINFFDESFTKIFRHGTMYNVKKKIWVFLRMTFRIPSDHGQKRTMNCCGGKLKSESGI